MQIALKVLLSDFFFRFNLKFLTQKCDGCQIFGLNYKKVFYVYTGTTRRSIHANSWQYFPWQTKYDRKYVAETDRESMLLFYYLSVRPFIFK